MKTIEERIMEVGAKVLDEMLLHNTDVVVALRADALHDDISVRVDVHPVTIFRTDEIEELKYRAQREGLPKGDREQIDRIWEMNKELDKEIKRKESEEDGKDDRRHE